MDFVKLNNGIEMPVLGLGTYMLQGSECEKCVSEAINLGYKLIDTAQMYGNEQAVGNAIKHYNRKDLFITTKLYSPSTSYERAKSDIEKSLNNLQTDYIDLLLIHEPYSQSLEMYKAMTEGVNEGKIRAIGISNFNKNQYLNFIKSCGIIPAVNQVECHIFYRQKDLQKMLKENGTHMQAWSPFACAKNNFFNNPVLKEIGEKYGKTTSQVGLKYLVQTGVSVIPKSSKTERLKENINIFDFNLTNEDVEKIMSLDRGKTLFGWY